MNGKTLTISPTQMAKACATFDTLAQQNQCMDQVSLDTTDMVNVLMSWDFGDDQPQMPRVIPKTVKDVAAVFADAAARLRVAKEQFEVMRKDQSERIEELEDKIAALEDDNSDLQGDLDNANEVIASLEAKVERLEDELRREKGQD